MRDVKDKVPVHDLEAEEAVLGSMMHSQEAAEGVQEILQVQDFYKDQHRYLFRGLCDLAGESKPGDIVMLANRLEEKGTLDRAGGREYLSCVSGDTPNPGAWEHYAGIVKGLSIRRRYIDAGYEIITAASDLSDDRFLSVMDGLEDNHRRERPVLATITAHDLQVMTFPPATYVVEKLLPAGLCFFAGAYKAGKSWMVLGLALAVARGDSFFEEPTAQGEVLFMGVEDNERRLQNRISSLCKDGWPDSLHLATRMPRLDDGGIEALEAFADDHSKTRLIVLDVWARIRGREKSRNMYADDYAALERVQSFASDRDIAVVAVHHYRKAGDDKDPFNRFSGSTGIGGGADALWSLDRARGECDASFITTGRDILDTRLALNFSEETGEWVVLGPLEEYTHSLGRLEIMQVLREAGRPVAPKDIASVLPDRNPSTIRTLLKKMVEAGEIEKVGRGEYVVKENVTFIDFHKDD